MVRIDVPWERMATIATIVQKAPTDSIGRTAVMKCIYFLQVLKDLPLGYNFTLYSYGPFDAHVLTDLEFAETFGFVSATMVPHTSGYSYHIQPGEKAARIGDVAADFIKKHEQDINWVLQTFGNQSARELELSSTIVYVDRETDSVLKPDEIIKKVHEIKHHFSERQIREKLDTLNSKGLLRMCSGKEHEP